MTNEELQAVAHIPDAEVRQDIADTQAEIRSLRWQMETVQEGIAKREAFVAKLEILLMARAAQAE
jgi:hypothetical protein